MRKVKVIKPLRINQHFLNVGDVFDVDCVKKSDLPKAVFFHPANVDGMPKGTFWLFTEKTFKVIA
tara:strand:- start:1139 stop:1333 length:195 start_codon:yes stop_codon:yes gene_type:complete